MAKSYKRYSPNYRQIRKVVNSMWWKQGWSKVAQHNHYGSASTDPTIVGFKGMVFSQNADYTPSLGTTVAGIQSIVSAGTLLNGTSGPTDYARGGTRYLKNFKFRWSMMDCTPHPTGGGVDIDMSFVMVIFKAPMEDQGYGYEALVNGSANGTFVAQRFFEYHDTATGQALITSNGGVGTSNWLQINIPSITLKNRDLCWCLYCIKNNSNTPVVMQMDNNWEYRVKGTAVQQ